MRSLGLSVKCNRSATLPFLLLCLLLAANAERDFNANDSQVPVIEPKDAPAYKQDPYVTELMRCQQTQNEIVLSLVLRRHDWSDMTVAKRTHVQAKLSKFFAIPREFITLDSVSKRELGSMHKLAMRKGGKGQKNVEAVKHRLGRASFMIGCGPGFFSMGEPIAKQIAHQVKDGTIGALTEENFGLWFIWRKESKNRSQRKRRQSEGSGNEDDDYDYGDEDEDQAPEPVTEVPATHAHRHHHGASDHSEISSVAASTPANKLDEEEIEESVSKLESVISKTIENTKNIKELPVQSVVDDVVDDVVDVEDAELQQQLGKTRLLGVPAAPVIVDSDNELELKEGRELEPQLTTTAATGGMVNAASKDEDAANNNQVDAAVDVAEHAATSTSQTTTNHNTNNNNINNNNNNNNTPATPGTPMPAFAHAQPSESYSPYDASPSVFHSSLSPSSIPSSVELVDMSTMSTTPTTTSSSSSSSNSVALDTTSSSTSSASTSTSASSSTASAIDTDMANTPTITATNTTTTAATTSLSSALAPLTSSLPTTSSLSTTTIATLPTTTTTATTTTRTQSQTPKATAEGDDARTVDSLDAASNNSVPNLASNELATPATLTTTTTSTTVETSVDYVESRQENTPPIIKVRMPKLVAPSGKAFRFVVPSETFYDAEDQTNLRLELTDKEGNELKPTYWLQLNAEKRELYGLPLNDDVLKWEYRLSATDSGNASVTESLEIRVQQHHAVRTINHEINIAVRINEKLPHSIDWQLKLIKAVAHTLDDGNSSALVVREIRQSPGDVQSASLIYYNETLPTIECPETELKELVRRFDAQRLNDLVQPLLSIKSITGQLIDACQKKEVTKTIRPTTQMAKNSPPMPRNQVDRVNASVGMLLVFKVPSDTFFDHNDSELKLTLKTKDHKDLDPSNWLQFDSNNQEFYGIPKSGDVGPEQYMLVAEDSGGLTANDALVVVVHNPVRKDYYIQYKAHLAIRTDNFNAELQRKFVERIAQLNGDPNTNNVLVRAINPHHDTGGTMVYFYNTTLYKTTNRCPDIKTAATRNVYLNSDLTPSANLRKALGPELILTNFTVGPASNCHHPANSDISQMEYIPPRHKEPSLKPTFPEGYLAFILPAIIIVAMILLASIIACCLHRRRHKSGKMELGDDEERKSFRTKGIPVIFQDEFEEKPEIGNKSPVILKDEKPPLLPPSYNTSNMNGENDVDEYVPPPAVVLGGREVRGKSPATPSYRKPPPYVSP